MSHSSRGALPRPFAGAADAWPCAGDDAEPRSPPDSVSPPGGGLDDLYRRHRGWLVEALRRRFGVDRAEDLSQETFVRARTYVDGPIGHPRALLMTIATNVARDHGRREETRAARHAALAAQPGLAATARPEGLLEDLHVRQALLELPPRLREVLLLSKIGGLTNREIAQRYGVSVRAIDKRMQKAVALLVTRLRD